MCLLVFAEEREEEGRRGRGGGEGRITHLLKFELLFFH